MVNERSEDDIITQSTIEVILGGEKHQIKPLVIKKSREWRKKVIVLLAPLPQLIKTVVDVENPEGFGTVLTQMMVTKPDQVLDLFFDFACDLNRDEIEDTATDKEMAAAFEEVVKVTFPLAESLPKVMGHLSQ